MKVVTLVVAALFTLIGEAIAQQPFTSIRAGRVLDGRGGILANATIVIQGSRIVRIDRNAKNATYDLGDLTVMPGWIDTHVHVASHFDRGTGRAHSAETKDETPQQAMLYA